MPQLFEYSFKSRNGWLSFCTVVLMVSCQSSSHTNEIRTIALKMKDNQCRIQEITTYVDDSWTKSIKELGNYLPERLPEQERKNILSLKNADLIRMFDSYDDFDPEGHELVDSMENLDIAWADSLRHLSMENQELEMKIDSLMSILEDPVESDRLNRTIEDIRSSSCEDEPIIQ